MDLVFVELFYLHIGLRSGILDLIMTNHELIAGAYAGCCSACLHADVARR